MVTWLVDPTADGALSVGLTVVFFDEPRRIIDATLPVPAGCVAEVIAPHAATSGPPLSLILTLCRSRSTRLSDARFAAVATAPYAATPARVGNTTGSAPRLWSKLLVCAEKRTRFRRAKLAPDAFPPRRTQPFPFSSKRSPLDSISTVAPSVL